MRLRLAAVLAALLLTAGFAAAEDVQTVLAPDGTLYTLGTAQTGQLELSRSRGEIHDTLIVPTTDDDAFESQARIAYDSATDSMFVLWRRSAEAIDEIRIASVNAEGTWSDARLVAAGGDVQRAGLQLTITHAREEGDEVETTLVHAAWWNIGAALTPEYAVMAFEGDVHLSTEVENLQSMSAGDVRAAAFEETGEAVHPPLVMSRVQKTPGVDILFGAKDTTEVTRVRVTPQRVVGEARIWRPAGRSITRTGPAKLISNGTAPVQAFMSGERVVLFTPDEQFRYIIFDKGEWTSIRMIELDENLTSDHVLQELQRTIEENETLEAAPTTD